MSKKPKKWIQKAVKPKERGKFTKWCKSHGFPGPTMACITAAKKMAKKMGRQPGKHLMGMANFAKTAKGGF